MKALNKNWRLVVVFVAVLVAAVVVGRHVATLRRHSLQILVIEDYASHTRRIAAFNAAEIHELRARLARLERGRE